MKTRQIFWGAFFIIIGILVLLNNYTSIDFDWGRLWDLWPLLLVAVGLNFIIKDSRMKWVFSLLGAVVFALVVFSAFKGFTFFFHNNVADNIVMHDDWKWDDEEWDSTGTSSTADGETNLYNSPMQSGITEGYLDIDAAAAKLTMEDPSKELVSIQTRGKMLTYKFEPKVEGNRADISFRHDDTHFRFRKGNMKNTIQLALNPNPVWNVDLDIGAASVDLDLSPYKTGALNFKSGASSMKVKLGSKSQSTRLHLESGVSSIEILVPKGSGCRVKLDNSLSSKALRNFVKRNDNLYVTDNYTSAKNKIDIELQAGVSSVKVEQY